MKRSATNVLERIAYTDGEEGDKMKEIKFRAWDKENKIMFDVWHIEWDNEKIKYINTSDKVSNYILMQYTGLKDKNRKEIYEGDIVEGVWIDVYSGKTKKKRMVIKDIRAIPDYVECRVIGNIYENPELLE